MHAIVLIVCKTSGKGTVIQIIAQYFTIFEKINKYFHSWFVFKATFILSLVA
jgi:hypothetical protein